MADSAAPRRRLATVVIALIAIALAAVGAIWKFDGVAPRDLPARALAVLSPSGTGALALQGNVEIRQVNLGFKVAGRIEKLAVDEGDKVVAGQTLASLEKVYFEDALAEARGSRDQAKANYEKMKAGNRPEDIAEAEATLVENQATLQNATQTLDRAQSLLNTASGTIKTYDDALGAQREAAARVNVAQHALDLMHAGFRVEDIEAARAQLAQQDAAVKVAERQLADADLIAPSSGVVESRAREVGSIVNVGEAVFVLSLTDPVWVRTYVSEPDLARVRPGMAVEVKPDSRDIPPMKGTIGFISTSAEFTPKTVETRELRTALVYRLRVVVEDPNDVLRQGMPVTVNVIGAETARSASAK
jgi:HlyD family secretion protein